MTEPIREPSTILARYADGPAQLEAAIAGLTESGLNLAPAADSWSIRQIVHHIVDGDDVWTLCIKAALGNSEGLLHFQWYWDKPQTEWAQNWAYASRAIEPSLTLFRANRLHVVDLIRQVPGSWERSIRIRWPNQDEGRITVGDVVESQANHTMGHIDDIRKIRQDHGLIEERT
jgi:hypothetical protein